VRALCRPARDRDAERIEHLAERQDIVRRVVGAIRDLEIVDGAGSGMPMTNGSPLPDLGRTSMTWHARARGIIVVVLQLSQY
jgi:hypothetical protein